MTTRPASLAASLIVAATMFGATMFGTSPALACANCNPDDNGFTDPANGPNAALGGQRWMSQLARAQQSFVKAKPLESLVQPAAAATDKAPPQTTEAAKTAPSGAVTKSVPAAK